MKKTTLLLKGGFFHACPPWRKIQSKGIGLTRSPKAGISLWSAVAVPPPSRLEKDWLIVLSLESTSHQGSLWTHPAFFFLQPALLLDGHFFLLFGFAPTFVPLSSFTHLNPPSQLIRCTFLLIIASIQDYWNPLILTRPQMLQFWNLGGQPSRRGFTKVARPLLNRKSQTSAPSARVW